MKYEYQGIKLGDSIEKIINLLNNENTKLNDFGTDLIYKTGSTIEDISTRIYICLYTGIVVMIKVFDQDFCLVEDLKIGLPITNEIIEKYGWIDGKVLGKTYSNKESINASLLVIFLHNPRRLNKHLREMLISEVKKGKLSSSTCMLILDKYYVVCEHRTIFNTAFKNWLKNPYVKKEDKWLSDSLMNELDLPLLPNHIIK